MAGRRALTCERLLLTAAFVAIFGLFGCSHRKTTPASTGASSLGESRSTNRESPQPAPPVHFEWPIRHGVISSRFGLRHGVMHKGIDIAAPVGTPVHAADSGRVIFAGRIHGYGRIIILRHNDRYSTVYAHTYKVWVSKGQYVSRGQVIATVGSSGRATGPNLHFEVRVDNRARDPLIYLDPMPPTVTFARRSTY